MWSVYIDVTFDYSNGIFPTERFFFVTNREKFLAVRMLYFYRDDAVFYIYKPLQFLLFFI